MRRSTVVVPRPGCVVIEEDELPPPNDGQLLLRTLASGLSAGTELAFVKGEHVGAGTWYDRELGLFRPNPDVEGRPAREPLYPVRRLGYMEVATVTESRCAAFAPGQVVATAYGHATAHLCDPMTEHLVAVPDWLAAEPLLAVFVAHMGPICANGLLHAAASSGTVPHGLGDGVRGRCIAVVGGGLVGLLVALFCAHHGAADVMVVEEDAHRRNLAAHLGLDSLDPGTDELSSVDAAATLKTRWRHGPADHGADVVFQCRGRSRALATALRLARPQGTIVDLAFYAEPASATHLGAEFHHNGLQLLSAQIGRTPGGTTPSWDRTRLSRETLELLQARGADIRQRLITDVVPFVDAPEFITDVAARKRQILCAVFTA